MSSHVSNSAEAPVEPLTRREREILAFLAQGLSGPEIAQKLTLAVSSVKWHTHQLYGKLGVNSKQRALRRAGELGLLDPSGSPAPKHAPVAPKHNLPLQVTRFFGREREIADLKERLGEQRLVTLTGSGGVGKTRLSLRAAEELLDEFPDGVWLVELASLAEGALVAQAVAATLGVRDEPGRPILDSLESHLRERQALVVLDNCEHLLEASARLADGLMRACPRLRILASSREPLGVPGEAVFPVPSLSYPEPGQAVPAGGLAEFAALHLYLDRARLVQPGYQPSERDSAALAYVVQRLDGIPLAIEMAASRINILNAEQLARRLDDVFRVLTGGSRTALPRQQTLRATMDWSYNLLSETERLLLQRLSVFAGGCTLEAAEAVCSGGPVGTGEVLDLLGLLAAKSLVIAVHPAEGEPRYRLLETVRQYAREKLQDSGEMARLRARHRDYFLAQADAGGLSAGPEAYYRWTTRLLPDLDNMRLALEWSFGDESAPDAAPRLVIGALVLWPSYREQADWAKRGITWCQDHPEVPAILRARILISASMPLLMDEPQTAVARMQEAAELDLGTSPEALEVHLNGRMHLADTYADFEAVESAVVYLSEAEAFFKEFEATQSIPKYHRSTATIAAQIDLIKFTLAFRQGLLQEAEIFASEAIRRFREAGEVWSVGIALLERARARQDLGKYEEARDDLLQSRDVRVNAPFFSDNREAYILHRLGKLEVQEGKLDMALENCRASLRLAVKIADYNIQAFNLSLAAGIAAKLGQPGRAARMAGAAQALYTRQHRNLPEAESLDHLLPGWRDGPDAPEIAVALEAGLSMKAEQAVAYVLAENAG